MSIQQVAQKPCTRVALVTLLCFLLCSTGWLIWLYRLTELVEPQAVDVLTMVVGYFMQALGMGAFAFVERKEEPLLIRRHVALALVAYVICLGPATLSNELALVLAFGYVANVICGYTQGFYLLRLARYVPVQRRGIVFGGAYAASTLASWLLSAIANRALVTGIPGLITCCVLAICAECALHLPVPADETTKTSQTICKECSEVGFHVDATAIGRPLIVIACTTVALLSLTKNAGFGFPTANLVEDVNLELSRLLYGVGLVFAGLVHDRNRMYGAICCTGALVTPFLMLALSGAAAPATLMWALDYLLFGFFAVFRVVLLADLAALTGRYKIAGFGLLFGRIGDALGTLLYVCFGGMPLVLIVFTSVLFACSLTLVFVLCQKLYVPKPQPSEQEVFERFAMKYDLSTREREVLRLVLDERTNAEIASELFVSEATIKYHVRNLLKKTDRKNRRELISLYVTAR